MCHRNRALTSGCTVTGLFIHESPPKVSVRHECSAPLRGHECSTHFQTLQVSKWSVIFWDPTALMVHADPKFSWRTIQTLNEIPWRRCGPIRNSSCVDFTLSSRWILEGFLECIFYGCLLWNRTLTLQHATKSHILIIFYSLKRYWNGWDLERIA